MNREKSAKFDGSSSAWHQGEAHKMKKRDYASERVLSKDATGEKNIVIEDEAGKKKPYKRS